MGNRRTKHTGDKKQANNKTLDLNPTISIITLNVNGLDTPFRRQRFPDWIEKQAPTTCSTQKTSFIYKYKIH